MLAILFYAITSAKVKTKYNFILLYLRLHFTYIFYFYNFFKLNYILTLNIKYYYYPCIINNLNTFAQTKHWRLLALIIMREMLF